MHTADPELLERSSQLAELERLEALANSGAGGQLVFVGGEAGVGKTALIRRFCAARAERRVVRGLCDSLTTPRALGPLLDVAEQTGCPLATRIAGGSSPSEIVATL